MLDYVKLSGMMESEHSANILFSPWSGTGSRPVCSACRFLGRHASIFTLAKGVRCLCLTKRVSLHQDPVGSTPAMTGGRAMGERQQKMDRRWQLQHKHLRVRTPPWKESEGCLFWGAAKGGGCPLWDSQADKQKGEQAAHHTAELGWEDPAYKKVFSRSSDWDWQIVQVESW